MDTSGIRNDRYERIASSGCVFREKPTAKGNSKNPQVNGILFRLIEEEMELSFRSQNCLDSAGIKLIGQLVQKSASELLDLKNFGRTSLREIEKVLTEIGLTLEMNLDFPPWNGDGNGAELIQILSLQRVGGGFCMDHKAAQILGIDFDEIKILAKTDEHRAIDNLLTLFTALILRHLEEKFPQGMPCLADVIQRQRKWLKKNRNGLFINQKDMIGGKISYPFLV